MKRLYTQRPATGFSLVVVLVTVGICFLLMTGVLLWSSNSGQMALRQTEHYATRVAAEAASEKIVARIADDFRTGGRTAVDNNLASYANIVPTVLEHAAWSDYDFLDSAGTPGRTEVGRISDWQYGPLDWRDGQLSGNSATYGILATARSRVSGSTLRASVRQELQIAAVPLAAFFMFSQLDLELNPGSGNWVVNGPVHANANLYCSPSVAVSFQQFVSAAGEILHQRAPGDPLSPGGGSVSYAAGRESDAVAARLPVEGLPADPANLWTTCISQADLRIEVLTLTNLVAYNKVNDLVPTNLIWAFVRTRRTNWPYEPVGFMDKRENDSGEVTYATEFDVASFTNQLAALAPYLVGAYPTNVYIADRRTPNAYSTYLSIKLVRGRQLPPGGLTLATPNPLYIRGSFNAPTTGSTNGAQRACLIADAVTVLSWAWDDSNGYGSLAGRLAQDTTVNASVVTGIVPTRPGNYGGGAENWLRLLEDWTGRNLYFNGSLAVLFRSRIAVGEWGRLDVYSPPNRVFRFTPCGAGSSLLSSLDLRVLLRSEWRTAQPGAAL